MQGRERAIDTLSVRKPSLTVPTNRQKEEKKKTAVTQRGSEQLGPIEKPALKTSQFHTIEYIVTTIV